MGGSDGVGGDCDVAGMLHHQFRHFPSTTMAERPTVSLINRLTDCLTDQ